MDRNDRRVVFGFISGAAFSATIVLLVATTLLSPESMKVSLWVDPTHVVTYEGSAASEVVLHHPHKRGLSCWTVIDGVLHQWAARADDWCDTEDIPN